MKPIATALTVIVWLTAGAAAAQQAPALVVEAIDHAMARGAAPGRWSFTRTASDGEGEFTARFTPAEGGGEWMLVTPDSPDALEDELRGAVERMMADELYADFNTIAGATPPDAEPGEDGGETPGMLEALAGTDMTLIREDEAVAVYEFAPPAVGEMAEFAESLTGELTVAKAGPLPFLLRYRAEESFKPMAVARVDALDIMITFSEVAPGGPLAATETRTRISGRAMFRAFSQDTVVSNSDFAAAP